VQLAASQERSDVFTAIQPNNLIIPSLQFTGSRSTCFCCVSCAAQHVQLLALWQLREMRETIFSATPVEATVHQVYTWVAANGSLLITVHLGGIRV